MEPNATILQFFFITEAKFIDWEDMKFSFGSEEEKKEYELDGDDRIVLYPEYPKPLVYYFETITVKFKDIEIMNFQFLVYINKVNNIILDLDEQNGRPSFELLFYAKYEELIPTKITYKNKEYKSLESYGNKRRNRIFFANVDPSKLQYINSKEMKNYKFDFNNQTYQALFRIYEKDKFEISMTDMESYQEYNMNYMNYARTKIKLSYEEFQTIKKKFHEFYEKYQKYMHINPEAINDITLTHSELINIAQIIKNNELYKCMENLDLDENQFPEELLELFHIDFSLNQFLKLEEENKFKYN